MHVKCVVTYLRHLAAAAAAVSPGYTVIVEASEPRPMVLHWAINDWEGPPEHIYPPGTTKVRI